MDDRTWPDARQIGSHGAASAFAVRFLVALVVGLGVGRGAGPAAARDPGDHRAAAGEGVELRGEEAQRWLVEAGPAEGGAGAPAELLCALGIQAYRDGKLEESVALLRRAEGNAESQLSGAARHYLGLALVRLGQTGAGRRVLAEHAGDRTAGARLLRDLGIAYLLEGNVAWAARTLALAREIAPDDGLGRYYLGVALLRFGQSRQAVIELQAAIAARGAIAVREAGGADGGASRPDGVKFANRSKPANYAKIPETAGTFTPEAAAMQLALALYREERWAEGREILAAQRHGARGPLARRLLRAGYEAEGTPAALVSAELETGLVIDSNPLYLHEMTAPPAMGATVLGSIVLRPWADARNLLWGQLAGGRTSYFALGGGDGGGALEVGDASASVIRAGGFYARRIPLGARWLQLSAGYGFGLIFLDGEPPLADENHIFLEEHGAHLGIELLDPHQGRATRLRFSAVRQDLAIIARSNWGQEIALEQGLLLARDRLRLLGWASVRFEAAATRHYNVIAPGAGAGATFLAPLGLVLGARLEYELRDHHDSEGGPWGARRRDHHFVITAEIGRALPLGLRLGAVYQRFQNPSTVASFAFQRDLASLQLSWSYR